MAGKKKSKQTTETTKPSNAPTQQANNAKQ